MSSVSMNSKIVKSKLIPRKNTSVIASLQRAISSYIFSWCMSNLCNLLLNYIAKTNQKLFTTKSSASSISSSRFPSAGGSCFLLPLIVLFSEYCLFPPFQLIALKHLNGFEKICFPSQSLGFPSRPVPVLC